VGWLFAAEILKEGFASSRVVMMNEGHHGYSRCVRTRKVGCSVLPAAHAAGCRHLALEALTNSGRGPTFLASPPHNHGYLGQPDMAAIIDTALGLGWTLVAYEVAWDQTPVGYRDQPLTMDATNHRELAQATNLAEALDEIGSDGQLMVWCGTGHHSKESADEWVPMGVRFTQVSGIDPFSIDQLATVSLAEGVRPRIELTSELEQILERFGGTAGFTKDSPPDGFEVPPWCDAMLLSTDNRMVGEVAPIGNHRD
jgi:hypothetical protein